jgi:ABC-type sugar transport system ATPase subunit
MPDVVVDGLSVRRGGTLVLADVSFTAPSSRITVIVGPSGAGKTSLLRALARLDRAERGTIHFGDRDVTNEPPGAAGSTLTFHDAALLPHRTVGGNVAFPLELQHVLADEVRRRVGVELRSLRIEALLHREPTELSVGEAQMVQVARALVRNPETILLDEPFAALERERAQVLRHEIRLLQDRFGATVIASTNDPDDARRFADVVVVLERGKVVQVGAATQVFDRPDTVAAAHLTGDAAVDVVRVEAGDGGGWWLVHPAFRVRAWAPVLGEHVGRRVQLVTRPEWWELDPNGTVIGTVTRGSRWGGDTTLSVDVAGHDLVVRVPPGDAKTLRPGDVARLRLANWVVIDPLDGRRIETGA